MNILTPPIITDPPNWNAAPGVIAQYRAYPTSPVLPCHILDTEDPKFIKIQLLTEFNTENHEPTLVPRNRVEFSPIQTAVEILLNIRGKDSNSTENDVIYVSFEEIDVLKAVDPKYIPDELRFIPAFHAFMFLVLRSDSCTIHYIPANKTASNLTHHWKHPPSSLICTTDFTMYRLPKEIWNVTRV